MPGSLRCFACCALVAAMVPAQAAVDPRKGSWTTTLHGRDLDGDRVADVFYDADLDLTWLANANVRGPLRWADALAWAASLDVHGITGWRLPTLGQQANCNPQPPPQECSLLVVPGTSELEHMFLATLGNTASATPDLATWNAGPFTGLQPAPYFTDQRAFFAPSFAPAWIFDMGSGAHDVDGNQLPLFAWAVHPGDIAPVPELPSLSLAMAGFALFIVKRRWRPRKTSARRIDAAIASPIR
jgi:hypothetical protein